MTDLFKAGWCNGNICCSNNPGTCIGFARVVDKIPSPTSFHDESLMKLTDEFNALIQQYMAERSDGRKLRLIILPDGHSFFAWAHPHGEEGLTSKDVEEKFGPVTWLDELSPEEAYSTLKLTPAGA